MIYNTVGRALGFPFGELYMQEIFHKSIVDTIMATNPAGIPFVKVEDFNVGSAFD